MVYRGINSVGLEDTSKRTLLSLPNYAQRASLRGGRFWLKVPKSRESGSTYRFVNQSAPLFQPPSSQRFRVFFFPGGTRTRSPAVSVARGEKFSLIRTVRWNAKHVVTGRRRPASSWRYLRAVRALVNVTAVSRISFFLTDVTPPRPVSL